MGLGETEAGETLQLLPDLVRGRTGDPVGGHARVDLVAQPAHGRLRPLVRHGLSQPVRLTAVEPGADAGHLHQLLLEDGHAQGLVEDGLGGGVGIAHRFLTPPPAQIRMDRLTLDGSGTDERHLHRQVVEGSGLHSREGGDLGPGLHLEQAHRVGIGQGPVDLRLLGDRGQVHCHPVGDVDEVDGQMEGVEHAQAQEVELHHPHRRRVVLVPLEDRPSLHPPPLQGDDLPQGTVGDHHSPRVDAEMAGKAVQPPAGVVDQVGGEPGRERDFGGEMGGIAAVDVTGERIDLGRGESEGLAHVPQHRSGPVGDDVGHHRRPLTSVTPVAILDHLLPPIRLEVEIDVGGPAPFLGQETLERELEPDRVDPGQPQAAAHGRVGAGAPDLAVDVTGAGELDDVPHHQEVAGESQPVDHVELVEQAAPGPRVDAALPFSGIHRPRPLPGEMAQVLHLRPEMTRHGEVGQAGCHQPQIERQPLPQLGRPCHGSRIAGEEDPHLLRGAEVAQIGGRPVPVGVVQRAAPGDGRQHLG